MADQDEIKDRQRSTWSKGDFAIGNMSVVVSELLCETIRLKANQRVLDVGTGTGNTALAAARRSCNVIAVDFVPAFVRKTRMRAAVEDLAVMLVEADMETMPFKDSAFDVVLSSFGCMFASGRESMASEMLRICSEGGKIGLACWVPDGFVGEFLSITSRYSRPAHPVNPSLWWGTEAGLRETFGRAVVFTRVRKRSFTQHFLSKSKMIKTLREHLGPLSSIYQSSSPYGRQRLTENLSALIDRYNCSGDSSVLIPSDYLEAVIMKRG